MLFMNITFLTLTHLLIGLCEKKSLTIEKHCDEIYCIDLILPSRPAMCLHSQLNGKQNHLIAGEVSVFLHCEKYKKSN